MVTETTKIQSGYGEAFTALQRNDANPRLPWLTTLRERAMNSFDELGFPSVKNEEWKYTNVTPIARANFKPSTSGSSSSISQSVLSGFTAVEAERSQLVFVNGGFRADLSSVSQIPEVVALDLVEAAAANEHSATVRQYLARDADYVANGFIALNTAFISGGAFVKIPKGITVQTPIHLLFLSDGASSASFPRVLLIAEENSDATIIESYACAAEGQYFTNAIVECVLKDGARVKHYKVQRESNEAFHVATTTADLGANASYDSTAITLGAALSRNDIHVTMDHEGAECRVDGLYLVTDNQHTDTHSVIDHRKPHCTSHQLYKGILDGKSRAVFNGKIFVRHDAQKTDALQTNKNLLLSNDARVDTKPQLEILADDVKCAHGAAVGQIDEDEMFYLETRGIHRDLARNLLTYGFAEEVIEKIAVASIRADLDAATLNRLNAKLEA
jgi:Fe-S cluster assembly protein SufD